METALMAWYWISQQDKLLQIIFLVVQGSKNFVVIMLAVLHKYTKTDQFGRYS